VLLVGAGGIGKSHLALAAAGCWSARTDQVVLSSILNAPGVAASSWAPGHLRKLWARKTSQENKWNESLMP
jgi:hypothetical protein